MQNTPRQSSQLVQGGGGGNKEAMKINTVSALTPEGEIASSGAFRIRTHRNSINEVHQSKNKFVKNRNAKIHSQIQSPNATKSSYLNDDIDSIEKRALQIKQIDKAPYHEQFYNAAIARRSPRNFPTNATSSLNISHTTDFIQQDASQASATIDSDKTLQQKLNPFTYRSKKNQQRERHLSNYSEVIRGNSLYQQRDTNEVTRDKTLKSQIIANQSEIQSTEQQLSAMNTEQTQQIPKVLLLPSINIKRLLQKYDEAKKPQKKRNQSVVPPLMHKTIFDQQQQAMQNEQHIDNSPEKQTTFYNQQSVNQLKEQIMGVVHSGSIPILDQYKIEQQKSKKQETWRVISTSKTKFDTSPKNSNTIFQHVQSGQQTIGGILGTLPTKNSIMAIITPKHNRIQVPHQLSTTDPLGTSKRHISMAPVYPQYKLQPKHLQPLNTVIEHLQQKLVNNDNEDEIESLRNSTTFSTRNPQMAKEDHHLRSFEDKKAPILQQYLPASLSIHDSTLNIQSGQTQVKEEVSPLTVKKYGKARTDLQLCLHNSTQGPVINGGPIVMFAREEKTMKKKQCSSNSIKEMKHLLTPNEQDQNKVTPSKPEDNNPMYCNQLDKIDESAYDSDSSCGYSGTLSSLMEGENNCNDEGRVHLVSPRKSTKRISHVQRSILAPVSMRHGQPLQIDVDSLERTPKNHLDSTIATPSSAISPDRSSPIKFRERLLSKRFKVELLPTNNSIEVHSGKRISLDKDDVFRQREHIRKIIQEDSQNSHKP